MTISNFSVCLSPQLAQDFVPTQYPFVQEFYLILVCILGVLPILNLKQRVNDFVGTESTCEPARSTHDNPPEYSEQPMGLWRKPCSAFAEFKQCPARTASLRKLQWSSA